jgi:LmbE family N-acetylglucosaminyl deacetylase
MSLPLRHLCVLSLLAAFAVAGNAAAQGLGRVRVPSVVVPEPPQAHGRHDDHRALSDAVRRAERATRGQVLSAERVQYDGRDVNRVKIVDDRGRVRVYWDDPQAQQAQDEVEQDQDGGAPKPPRRTRDADGRSD